MKHFRLSPLRGDRILQAYPLVCAADGDISISDWRGFAKSILGAKSRDGKCCDIIGICASNGYLRGLFTYMVRPDPHHGRTLEVEYFVVESIYSPREIVEALMVGVEEQARKHGCKAIHAQIAADPDWLSEMLESRSYRVEPRIWCKRSD